MSSPVLATVLMALAAGAPTAHAAVEFAGYVVVRGETKFVLRATESGKVSPWLGLGGSLDGHTVIGFDAKKEVLAVEKAGTVSHLPLRAARVLAASPAPAAGMAATRPTPPADKTIVTAAEIIALEAELQRLRAAAAQRETAVPASPKP